MSIPQSVSATDGPYHDVLVSFLKGCGVAEEKAGRIIREVAPEPADQLNKTEISDLLLSLVGRGVDDRHPVTYVSVPITTGRAYLDWCIRHPDSSRRTTRAWVVRQEVSDANRRHARDVIGKLRARLPGMVIDPSSLVDIDHWKQADYHAFWLKVISKHADELLFIDGWQYSVGCTIEFAEGVRLSLPLLTERREQFDVDAGLRLIYKALQEYSDARIDSTPLRGALETAEKAATKALKSKEATSNG